MKREFLIAFILFCLSLRPAHCENIELTAKDISDYQIVIPEPGNDKYLDGFIEQTAVLLQETLKESLGVKLRIIKESEHDPGKPSLYIGQTDCAKSQGIEFQKMRPWEYAIKTSEKNIILTGADKRMTPKRHYTNYSLGTVKAVTSFLERFCGVSFVMPGKNGIVAPRKEKLEIPTNIDIKAKPHFIYSSSRSQSMFYDISLNQFSSNSVGIKLYGGHSYNIAVPTDKYLKTNPEYFALIKNKRYGGKYNHLCISNPDVREMIYQEMLKKLDDGYETVELGQSDGYRPCECEKCKKLSEGKNKGEVLWIFHKKLAERLLKERPNKKVIILSYGPTAHPPESFKEFPSNTMIELCKSSPEILDEWERVKVPQGFVCYIYDWGYYHLEGFTPKRTPEFIEEQIRSFRKHNIRGMYKCGYGELPGLEGPVYYVYGKLLEAPDASPEGLTAEYIKAAFGNAEPEMKRFYDLLHKRLEINLPRNTEWDKIERDGNTKEKQEKLQKPLRLLASRYPENVISALNAELSAAKKKAEDNAVKVRLKRVRLEFEYLRLTAEVANLYKKYLKAPSRELFAEVMEKTNARKKFIASLPAYKNGYLIPMNGIKVFGNIQKPVLLTGGRLNCVLKNPYNWNFDALTETKTLPGKRKITAKYAHAPIVVDGKDDDAVWKTENGQRFFSMTLDSNDEFPATAIKIAWDETNLYLLFEAEPPKGKDVDPSFNSFMFFIAPNNSLEACSRFRFSRSSSAGIDKFDKFDPKGRPIFKNTGSTKPSTVASGEKDGKFYLEAALPFELTGITPSKGKALFINASRRRKLSSAIYDWQDCIWQANPAYKTWRDTYKSMGQTVLEDK